MINLPLDSSSTIVHLYRQSIATRYNLTFDADDEQTIFSSISAKWNEENPSNNNKTGHRDSSTITKGN